MTEYANRRLNPRYAWPVAPKPGPFYRKEPAVTTYEPHINALGKWTCGCEANQRFPWVLCNHILAAIRRNEAADKAWDDQANAPGIYYDPEAPEVPS